MRLVLALLLASLACTAGAQTSSQAMFVKFEVPRREPVLVTVSYEEALRLSKTKSTVTIGFWIEAALAKSKLRHHVNRVNGREWVTQIAGVRETAKARWVVFVDGERVEVHMNTRPAFGAHSIRLAYEAP
jgi:hypothetical protein